MLVTGMSSVELEQKMQRTRGCGTQLCLRDACCYGFDGVVKAAAVLLLFHWLVTE
jgi:hypothetical protein